MKVGQSFHIHISTPRSGRVRIPICVSNDDGNPDISQFSTGEHPSLAQTVLHVYIAIRKRHWFP